MKTPTEVIQYLKNSYNSDKFQFSFICAMVLAGDGNSKLRQDISTFLGQKMPKSKCGLNKISEMIQAHIEQADIFETQEIINYKFI